MPRGVYTRRKYVRPSNKGKGAAAAWCMAHMHYDGDDCLPWPFSKDPNGRGRLGHNGEHYWSHRFMCELVNGPPPTPKHQAAHNCGNGHLACMTPRHLDWKTNTENQLDRTLHGTKKVGGTPRNKLTAEQVARIRALRGRKTQYELAEMFGVKRGTIEYWLRRDASPKPLSERQSAIRRRLAA